MSQPWHKLQVIANTFNSYFVEKVKNLKEGIDKKLVEDPLSRLKNKQRLKIVTKKGKQEKSAQNNEQTQSKEKLWYWWIEPRTTNNGGTISLWPSSSHREQVNRSGRIPSALEGGNFLFFCVLNIYCVLNCNAFKLLLIYHSGSPAVMA